MSTKTTLYYLQSYQLWPNFLFSKAKFVLNLPDLMIRSVWPLASWGRNTQSVSSVKWLDKDNPYKLFFFWLCLPILNYFAFSKPKLIIWQLNKITGFSMITHRIRAKIFVLSLKQELRLSSLFQNHALLTTINSSDQLDILESRIYNDDARSKDQAQYDPYVS